MTEQKLPFEQIGTLPSEFYKTLWFMLLEQGMNIEQWTPEVAHEIYEKLEHPNWAPWLEASEATIAGRAKVFPQGQLVLKEQDQLVASVSMNQIQWDGNPDSLPSWDQVAGIYTTDYSETYNPNGNTLVMLSMNVASESKGKRLPSKLIEYSKYLAKVLGMKHLIGSFRPNGYGAVKKQFGFDLPFWDYCQMTQAGSKQPIDPWLRSLSWHGMKMIKPDSFAMVVGATNDEFEHYKSTYKPDKWKQIHQNEDGVGIWECEEVGQWMTGLKKPLLHVESPNVYAESNVWGSIPIW